MIVADPKPVEEVAQTVAGYTRIHVLGCGGCVSVCLSGGEREARQLALELTRPRYYESRQPPKFTVSTIERQCERDWLAPFLDIPEGTEAILSLACGVGVQIVADEYDPMPVIPALNTTFMGGLDAAGMWREKCRGCGDCVLAYTGSVCPITRCAKSLFNGPCGGTSNGACEVDPYQPCAWALIYFRLKKQNQLDRMLRFRARRDWIKAGGLGPRVRLRTGIGGSAGD